MSDNVAGVDSDVLSDVLAFLDGFDEQHTDLDSALSSPSSDVDHDSRSHSSMTTLPSPEPTNRSRTNYQTSVDLDKMPRSRRLDRYWNKKHEMNKLRGEVEYLSNKLELLRQCARSPAEIKVTSDLGVTIRKVCHWRLSNWKRLATHERVMRERAERTNAKLRVLLQYQLQWTDGVGNEVAQSARTLSKVPSIQGKPQVAVLETETSECRIKITSKIHDATWGEVLRQLYLEACAFATGTVIARIETFDWVAASEPALRSKPLLEWKTSFQIPRRDPRGAGGLWWEAFQHSSVPHGSCEDSHGVHERLIPRMEKTCKWSLLEAASNRKVHATSITVFENRQSDKFWIMAWTTTVYDASGGTVLFRGTAAITVTKADASNAQSSVARAHYRIHDPSAMLVPGQRHRSPSESGEANQTDLTSLDAKVAMDNWVSLMRSKDHQLQRAFLQS